MANGKNGRLKKMLGMTKRPTTAGQAQFGDVEATGKASSSQEPSPRPRSFYEVLAGNTSSDPVTRAEAAGWKGYDEDLWPMGPERQAERFLEVTLPLSRYTPGKSAARLKERRK